MTPETIRHRFALTAREVLLIFISLVITSPVLANGQSGEPIKVKSFADGGVEVQGHYFSSELEFQQSDLFRAGGYRCATPDRPLHLITSKVAADCSMSSTTTGPQYEPAAGILYRIPVVFHVIKKTDGVGNIPLSRIFSQIDILNEDFRALPGSFGANGTDARVEFFLATTDPSGNSTGGIKYYTSNTYFTDPGPDNFNDMKAALNWDPARYLNIYTNDAAGYLGYATFPQQDAGTDHDGVVLRHTAVGRNAPETLYDQGRTATHEVGHYLGIFHTFQGGCGLASAPYTTGDLIADTNRQSAPNYNCPAGATSCSSSDPIENYMNYTQDTCMEEFTPEQINRMRCSIESYRWDLINHGPQVKYPNPKVFGQPVGAKGTPVSGGTIWPYSTPRETARRFCQDQGLPDEENYKSSTQSTAYAYVVGTGGTGPWSVTGNSGVTILDQIDCRGTLDVTVHSYSTPKISGVRVGRSTTSSISREETAKQFCIYNGHEPGYTSWNINYPTGTTYIHWTGSSWSVTGNSSVELFTYVNCADID